MATQQFNNEDGRLRGRGLQQRRLRKWTEAEGCCVKCGCLTEFADPRTNPRGFHLDHIAMLEKSKDDSEENTQVLCFACHDVKSKQDMGFRPKPNITPDGWPE